MIPPQVHPPIDTQFDVVFADSLARYETYNKHHYRPNTYLHKWWGRRCGSTFRLILKGLVEDEATASYYAAGGLQGKIILDPMMGGGTTIHEAIRMGASVIGVDVDPIPVVQARATLTEQPLAALQSTFQEFFDGMVSSIGGFYQTHCPTCDEPVPLWHTLYGLRRHCLCGDSLMVDSLIIRHEPDGTTLRWCPECGEVYGDRPHSCGREGIPLVEKGQKKCPACGQAFGEYLNLPYFRRYEMLAVAGHCEAHGLFHKSPDWRDREALARAEERRSSVPLPDDAFCIVPGDKSIQLQNKNIHTYLDLFSSRQLIFLNEVMNQLPLEDAIGRLNLALLVSTSLEFNSMLCGYKGASTRRAGAVRHTFAHHGYSFPYTALENNPIYPRRASGTLQKLFHSRIERGRRWASAPKERQIKGNQARFEEIAGERDAGTEVHSVEELQGGPQRFYLLQGSSVRLPIPTGSIDAVVTDPPYYDSIQYGDLSAFFRVWLHQFLPDIADWRYDQSAAAVNSERNGTDTQFVELLGGIFQECRRVLRPECGRLIFTFHHWQPQAWAALCTALHKAGFILMNRYVVHAEHPMSVHISKMRALTHDAILVLAPRDTRRHKGWENSAMSDRSNSHQFTDSCASFLGWVLDQPDLSGPRIDQLWAEKLAENGRLKSRRPTQPG